MADLLILEGVVTTLDETGAVNIAPMGPLVDRELHTLTLRPFQTSQTYRNLKQTGRGILHVTDDVELIARAAIGQLQPVPRLVPAPGGSGQILADACRWLAFRVVDLDDSAERTTIRCAVTDQGELRPFLGFNRAKHAVLEAAILATRIGIPPAEQIQQEMQRLAIPVQKTAGEQERRAFALLQAHIAASQK
jgi:hypothetical protein